MAKAKTNYNKKDTSDLLKEFSEKEKQLLDTNMSIAQGKTKNVHAARMIRIEIARIKTAIKYKELEKN